MWFNQPPIKYNEPVFRPPSEGRSLLIQVTIGCSNNLCTYCNMYRSKKYRERNFEEIKKELVATKYFYKDDPPDKIFLCDGDALGASFILLKKTLNLINELFPSVRQVGVYATADNILKKSDEELEQLQSLGLGIVYLGMESGNDLILKMIVKGNNSAEMLQSSLKIKKANIKISIIAMLGVGGIKYSKAHIDDTSTIISKISPNFFSFLTTVAIPGTPYEKMVQRGLIKQLSSRELLQEMHDMLMAIKPSNGRIIFRANHVSNMHPIGGNLPSSTNSLLKTIDKWILDTPIDHYPKIPTHML